MQWGVVNIFGEAPQSFGLGSSRKIVVYGGSYKLAIIILFPEFIEHNVKGIVVGSVPD